MEEKPEKKKKKDIYIYIYIERERERGQYWVCSPCALAVWYVHSPVSSVLFPSVVVPLPNSSLHSVFMLTAVLIFVKRCDAYHD